MMLDCPSEWRKGVRISITRFLIIGIKLVRMFLALR